MEQAGFMFLRGIVLCNNVIPTDEDTQKTLQDIFDHEGFKGRVWLLLKLIDGVWQSQYTGKEIITEGKNKLNWRRLHPKGGQIYAKLDDGGDILSEKDNKNVFSVMLVKEPLSNLS